MRPRSPTSLTPGFAARPVTPPRGRSPPTGDRRRRPRSAAPAGGGRSSAGSRCPVRMCSTPSASIQPASTHRLVVRGRIPPRDRAATTTQPRRSDQATESSPRCRARATLIEPLPWEELIALPATRRCVTSSPVATSSSTATLSCGAPPAGLDGDAGLPLVVVDVQAHAQHPWGRAGLVMAPTHSPRVVVTLVRHARLVVACSLHLCIFAIGQKVPFSMLYPRRLPSTEDPPLPRAVPASKKRAARIDDGSWTWPRAFAHESAV